MGDVNVVPFFNRNEPPAVDSFFTAITPAARFTWSLSTS